MSENSSIEWTDHTFNPWIGCTKVSPACDNCYAARQDAFRHWTPEGWGGPRKRTKTWRDPVRWNAAHGAFFAQRRRRQRVFCASLADVFDNQVPAEWRADLFELIRSTPNLDWLLLTKRPQNIVRMVRESGAIAGNGTRYLPDQVALGTTVEDQPRADVNIQALVRTRNEVGARTLFLSIEPMLGPINLLKLTADARPVLADLDWVIAGGESGPHARPAHPDWFRSLRDQCAAAGVPFLFKQWGEWVSVSEVAGDGPHHRFADGATVRRIGKRAAGRLLDGVTHDGFPGLA